MEGSIQKGIGKARQISDHLKTITGPRNESGQTLWLGHSRGQGCS